MHITFIEEAFGHYFIRFAAGKNEAFDQCLDDFKSIVPRNDRFFIQERRVWAIRGSDETVAKLAFLLPDFYRKLAFAQNQLVLFSDEEEPFINPFEE